jgi:hypothetical protein
MKRTFAMSIVKCLAALAILLGGARPAAAAFQVAYAHVDGNGNLDNARSQNVSAFQGSTNGLFCFLLPFTPQNAVATIVNDPTAVNQGPAIIEVSVPPVDHFTCSNVPGANAFAITFPANGGASTTFPFYIYWTSGTPSTTAPAIPVSGLIALAVAIVAAGAVLVRRLAGAPPTVR